MRSEMGALVLVAALLACGCAKAHGGGHKTGEYHCHGGGSAKLTSPAAGLARSDRSAGRSRPFANCAEARAAGAAPVRRGDPGYAPHLDRDNDGIGCE